MDSQEYPLDEIDGIERQPVIEVPVSGEPAPPVPVARSPRWGETTKLVVGLSLVAVGAFLVFRFLNIVGPLLLAFVLAYLFHPLASFAQRKTGISWRTGVTILYILLLILLLGAIGVGGYTVVEQVTALIGFLETKISDLPGFLTNLSSQPLQIGPFTWSIQLLDINELSRQILNVVQPVLTQAGSSVVTVAAGAATFLGWLFFIVLVSYFILAESGGLPNRLMTFSIPGHEADMLRLGDALSRIWNAFLRGQITIVLLTIFIYDIILGGLGVRFFFGLALLAGLARFVPYVGPFVAWTSYGLVALFNGSTIFGLTPVWYAVLVVGMAWLTDVILDNVVVPRLMSNALRVHPAAVMVSALVAYNLLGVIGVVLAAPVLATVKLMIDYIIAKLFDQDPWAGMETIPSRVPLAVIPEMMSRYEQLRDRVRDLPWSRPSRGVK